MLIISDRPGRLYRLLLGARQGYDMREWPLVCEIDCIKDFHEKLGIPKFKWNTQNYNPEGKIRKYAIVSKDGCNFMAWHWEIFK